MKLWVKQHKESGENTLTQSVLPFLVSLIPPHFHFIDHRQQLFSLVLWRLCCRNESGNTQCGIHFPKRWGFCILHPISGSMSDSLSPSRLRCQLDYPSPQSSQANFRCLKYFQVYYPHCFLLDGGRFFSFNPHSTLQFILQGGPLQTKLVAQAIFPKI